MVSKGRGLRWQEPEAAANGYEQAHVQRNMQHMVATSNMITTSLQSQFGPLIYYHGVEQAGVQFAKTMNKSSQDGRGVGDAMTAQDVHKPPQGRFYSALQLAQAHHGDSRYRLDKG